MSSCEIIMKEILGLKAIQELPPLSQSNIKHLVNSVCFVLQSIQMMILTVY